ncbi:hypothetical protein [Leeuwenhoekiella parthenopeia]|uniref:Uncharacterized protein n=1 Tax=Leeuwenhoekiella parthenopeia TaxID=2890320 RepID=A0ABS8GP24_9FLAO|nr:hypothetical protein [Leeuwenhoekiella parthenopeia]MCC4211710.1 hypothetical protein [Leeuwenhoekiella parthenopeia]
MNYDEKKKGTERNKLLRYKKILDVYLEHKTEDIPTAVVYRKYIYPQFFISRTTLYAVLGTPVNKLLKELGEDV